MNLNFEFERSVKREANFFISFLQPEVTEMTHLSIKETEEEDSLLIVQELCESRGGRSGLSVLASLLVSVDVKLY